MSYIYIDKKRFKGQTSAIIENGLIPPTDSIKRKRPLSEVQKRKLKTNIILYSKPRADRIKKLMQQGFTFEQAQRRTIYLI